LPVGFERRAQASAGQALTGALTWVTPIRRWHGSRSLTRWRSSRRSLKDTRAAAPFAQI